MEPLFETTVSITFEIYRALCFDNLKKLSRIITYLFLFIILGIAAFFLTESVWISIVFVLLYFGFFVFLIHRNIKKTWQSSKINVNETKYYFYLDAFEARNDRNYSLVKYDELYKVKETKDYYYLYVAKNQAHIISKENCSEGLLELLSNVKMMTYN